MTQLDPSQDRDKILFTPGPLTTSRTVKEAMLRDLGSRDSTFVEIVAEIRDRLLRLAQVTTETVTHTAIPMQGSGTFAIESVVASCLPPNGKLLTLVNGAYGRRIADIADMLGIDHVECHGAENRVPDLSQLSATLKRDATITHVAAVHCETTTGIMNPIHEIGSVVAQHDKRYVVDAMSSFGAVQIDVNACHIDYLVSSANKCIEGVPGFGFVVARKNDLSQTEGFARSLSFDLLAQWKTLEATGQFRFTPPTHALLAFRQALVELDEEGGVEARARRYAANHALLTAGMRKLGFREYLNPNVQGHIITSFHYPDDPSFRFEAFYQRLNELDMVIYPGKVSEARCFRIGTIGQIFAEDVERLLAAIESTVSEMGIKFRR
ncbi:MAG: 2-aminoethylphosphonate--pyruvate transaminase [Myxococcota bacterium]